MCGGRKGAAPDSQAATIPEGAQFSLIPGPASGAPQGVWCFCLSQLLGMAFPSSWTLGQDCVHPGNRILIPESLLQPFPHPLTHCLALFWGSSAIFHSDFPTWPPLCCAVFLSAFFQPLDPRWHSSLPPSPQTQPGVQHSCLKQPCLSRTLPAALNVNTLQP